MYLDYQQDAVRAPSVVYLMSGDAAPHRLSHASDKDQHKGLAYACYFLLGSGILAPWNAFITAADYFEAVFPGRHVDRLFTVAYLPVCLVLLGVMTKYNTAPLRPRILSSFAGFVAIVLAMPLVDGWMVGDSDTGSSSALALTLLAVVLVGVLDGLSQGAIFSDAATLPPRYTHAVVGGTASSGVVICLIRIITKAALPATRAGLRTSTALYFGISGAICLACWGVYYAVLPRLGVVRHHRRIAAGPIELSPLSSMQLDHHNTHSVFTLGIEDELLLIQSPKGQLSDHPQHLSDFSVQHGYCQTQQTHSPDSSSGHRLAGHSNDDNLGHPRNDNYSELNTCGNPHVHPTMTDAADSGGKASKRLPWQHAVAQTWQSALAMFVLYVTTLSIFPGVLAEDTKSQKLGSWYPVILITVFNVTDMVGKNIPFCGITPKPPTLLGLSVLRVLFVPAFMVAGRYAADVALLMGALTVCLGFTNGFLTALLMTLAPASVEIQEAGLVESVMVFSLVSGLTVGALAGWLWLL